MRVAVTGATGRMGREVLGAARERNHWTLAVSSSDPGGGEAADATARTADLTAALGEHDPDALVDFTVPAASLDAVAACAEAGVPAVVGTTGFDEAGESRLREAAAAVPVLRAANFARGVQALVRAVRAAVRDLPGYDVELTETHHNAKRDAPSGTAGELLDAIAEERERAGDGPGERVHGREGEAPRERGEIGVHARRAGDITGEHEVLLAGNHEVLSLTHRAESRGVFAAGALDAAEWLRGRNPGYYAFADVLDDR